MGIVTLFIVCWFPCNRIDGVNTQYPARTNQLSQTGILLGRYKRQSNHDGRESMKNRSKVMIQSMIQSPRIVHMFVDIDDNKPLSLQRDRL